MRRATLSVISTLVIVLSLSACAELRGVTRTDERARLNTWDLKVEGQSAVEALGGRSYEELVKDERSKAGEALRELAKEFREFGIDLDTPKGRSEALKQIERLREGEATAEETAGPLLGIEGISTAAFLRSALAPNFRVVTKGRIRDYIYLEQEESGHLAVDMLTEIYDSGKLVWTIFHHWDIELLKGHFKKHIRQGSPSNPNNPFPTLPEFQLPPEALDPNNPRSIWARDLNLKIYAKGVDAIKIRNVFLQINNGEIRRLPDSNALYKVTEKSCVDLFTTGFPPGETPPSVIAPKSATELFAREGDYCLGRCAHPFIINTGGD